MEFESIEERDNYKNKAVEEREKGNLQKALEMFEEIEKWDIPNKNAQGQMDVLGHQRITFSRLADETEDESERAEYREKALSACKEAIEIGEALNLPMGAITIQKVHLASTEFDIAREENNESRGEQALETVNDAIEDLPGSEAHKAWPMNVKAKILNFLGRENDALDTTFEAEKDLYAGYDDEIDADDQAELKLRVWLTGLLLTRSNIYKKAGKTELARVYASSVAAMQDPDGTLGERKKQAQRILSSL